MNLTNTVGWTLIHFLWEGALIAALLAAALAFLRHAGSRVRYAVSCAALMLMLVFAVATFIGVQFMGERFEQSRLEPPTVVAETNLYSSTAREAGAAVAALSGTDFAGYFPLLVWAWLGGVMALSIRSLGGWAVAERFARPAPPRRIGKRHSMRWQNAFVSPGRSSSRSPRGRKCLPSSDG